MTILTTWLDGAAADLVLIDTDLRWVSRLGLPDEVVAQRIRPDAVAAYPGALGMRQAFHVGYLRGALAYRGERYEGRAVWTITLNEDRP